MPTATNTNITSTRFSAASIVAGMTVPVLAGATATDADAELPLVPRLAGASGWRTVRSSTFQSRPGSARMPINQFAHPE
jgi:hypothetical protein